MNNKKIIKKNAHTFLFRLNAIFMHKLQNYEVEGPYLISKILTSVLKQSFDLDSQFEQAQNTWYLNYMPLAFYPLLFILIAECIIELS